MPPDTLGALNQLIDLAVDLHADLVALRDSLHGGFGETITDIGGLRVGDRVQHPAHLAGTIESITRCVTPAHCVRVEIRQYGGVFCRHDDDRTPVVVATPRPDPTPVDDPFGWPNCLHTTTELGVS